MSTPILATKLYVPPPQSRVVLRPRLTERPAAWLSLNEGDGDPTRFLAYLVAALQTIAPNIAEGVLGALQSPQPPPTESILTVLLNEVTTVEDEIVLVLDD